LITVSGTKAGKLKPVVAAVQPGKIERAVLRPMLWCDCPNFESRLDDLRSAHA